MQRLVSFLFAALCLGTFGAACGGSDDDSTPAAQGGYVDFSHLARVNQPARASAQADFYSEVTPPDAAGQSSFAQQVGDDPAGIPIDGCIDVPRTGFTPRPDTIQLDVGDTVTLNSGSQSVLLSRIASGSDYYYGDAGIDAPTLSVDTTWDIQLSGSPVVQPTTWTGGLLLPDIADMTAPAPGVVEQVTPGQEWEWTWNAGRGELFVQVPKGNDYLRCRLADDGSFALPADEVDLIDAQGTMTLVTWNRQVHALNGRSVVAVGWSMTDRVYSRQ